MTDRPNRARPLTLTMSWVEVTDTAGRRRLEARWALPAAAASEPYAAWSHSRLPDDVAGDYTLDTSHTRLGFSARHAMVTTVRGAFKDFAGTAHLDTADPSRSWVKITIQVVSVDTGSADRDGHLTSGDFFEAETHPEMTFESTAVQRADDTTWVVTGNLTIKGATKPVTIDFEQTGSARDPFGNLRVGFEGSTTINRKD